MPFPYIVEPLDAICICHKHSTPFPVITSLAMQPLNSYWRIEKKLSTIPVRPHPQPSFLLSLSPNPTPSLHAAVTNDAKPTTPLINRKLNNIPGPRASYSLPSPSIRLFRLISCCSCVHKCPSRSKCGTSLPAAHPCGPCPGEKPPPAAPPLPAAPLASPAPAALPPRNAYPALPSPACVPLPDAQPSCPAARFAPCAPQPPLR